MSTLASKSFKTQKVLPGKQYRDGTLGDALSELYKDVDNGFAQLEDIANVGFANVRFVYTANQAALATADKTPDGATAVVAGDRVLLTAQASAWENGIYVVGEVTGTCVLTRATDMDSLAEVGLGQSVWVTAGDTYANTEWRITAIPTTWGSVGSLTFTLQSAGSFIPLSIVTARNDIIVGNGVGLVRNLAVTESTIVGRGAAVDVDALTPGEARAILACDTPIKTEELIGVNTVRPNRMSVKGYTALGAGPAFAPTAAQLVGGLLSGTQVAPATLTTPVAADIIAEAGVGAAVGTWFEFTFVNLSATVQCTISPGDGSVTVVGDAVVAAATSGTFVALVTGAATVSIFRK